MVKVKEDQRMPTDKRKTENLEYDSDSSSPEPEYHPRPGVRAHPGQGYQEQEGYSENLPEGAIGYRGDIGDPPSRGIPVAGAHSSQVYPVGGAHSGAGSPPQQGHPGGAGVPPLHQGHPGPGDTPPQAPLSEGYRRDRVAFYRLQRAMVNPQIVMSMFSRADQDEDAQIDVKELHQALVNMGWATVTEDDCWRMILMIYDLRENRDGELVPGSRDSQINISEFHYLILYIGECKKLYDEMDTERRGFIEFIGFPHVTLTDFIMIFVSTRMFELTSDLSKNLRLYFN